MICLGSHRKWAAELQWQSTITCSFWFKDSKGDRKPVSPVPLPWILCTCRGLAFSSCHPALPNPSHFPMQPSAFSTFVLSCQEAIKKTVLNEYWQHCQGVSANISWLQHCPSFFWSSRSWLYSPTFKDYSSPPPSQADHQLLHSQQVTEFLGHSLHSYS